MLSGRSSRQSFPSTSLVIGAWVCVLSGACSGEEEGPGNTEEEVGGSSSGGALATGGALLNGGANSATGGQDAAIGGAPAGAGGSDVASGGGAAGGTDIGSGGGNTGAGGADASSGGALASSGGMMGTGGASAGPCGAAGITFCTDFEEAAIPSELTFWPEYLRPEVASYFSLDSSTAVSGNQSIKVTGSGFSQMYSVPIPGATFWGRVHLMSDTDIQNGHNTYLAAVTGGGDPNEGEAIRIGEHQCQVELNRKTDDAELLSNGGTYECSGGVFLTANQWYCFEYFYDGTGGEVRVFIDDSEVTELHTTDWGPYDYQSFKFGYEMYHGSAKNIWYDDLAIGTERIGCN